MHATLDQCKENTAGVPYQKRPDQIPRLPYGIWLTKLGAIIFGELRLANSRDWDNRQCALNILSPLLLVTENLANISIVSRKPSILHQI